jgi:hypothetical protein
MIHYVSLNMALQKAPVLEDQGFYIISRNVFNSGSFSSKRIMLSVFVLFMKWVCQADILQQQIIELFQSSVKLYYVLNQASGIVGSTNFANFSNDSCHPK